MHTDQISGRGGNMINVMGGGEETLKKPRKSRAHLKTFILSGFKKDGSSFELNHINLIDTKVNGQRVEIHQALLSQFSLPA